MEQAKKKKMLCYIGLHRWATREIHQAGPIGDNPYVDTVVLDRCECGKCRIPFSGEQRRTCWVVPEQYSKSGTVADETEQLRAVIRDLLEQIANVDGTSQLDIRMAENALKEVKL